MSISAKQEELVIEAYQQWLNHPITGLLLNNLTKHKDNLVNSMVSNATNTMVSGDFIRFNAISVKNTDAIIKLITDYDTFKTQLTK